MLISWYAFCCLDQDTYGGFNCEMVRTMKQSYLILSYRYMICCMLFMNLPLLYIYGINDVWILNLAAVQKMDTMEQLEPHTCISLSRLSYFPRPHFYQTRSAWSVDQGSNKNHSPAYNFAPTVTKFCVMWEGLSLPHDTKFGNCRCKIVDSRSFPSWSLIHGLRWSGLIKVGPGFGWN